MKSVGTILALSEDLHTKNQAPCLQFANNRESVTCGLEIFQKCRDTRATNNKVPAQSSAETT